MTLRLLPLGWALLALACSTQVETLERGTGPDAGAQSDAGSSPSDSGSSLADAAVSADADAGREPDASSIGLACQQPSDCPDPIGAPLPACVDQADNPWPGGYCIAGCTPPPNPFTPPELQRADCPEGAVCVAGRTNVSTGEPLSPIGVCAKECRVDGDCRVSEGYYCRHDFGLQPPVSFSNGICAPMHCGSRGCPRSFICGC